MSANSEPVFDGGRVMERRRKRLGQVHHRRRRHLQRTTANIHKNTTSVTVTVDGVAHATHGYDAEANHDADGDNTGTAISIMRP